MLLSSIEGLLLFPKSEFLIVSILFVFVRVLKRGVLNYFVNIFQLKATMYLWAVMKVCYIQGGIQYITCSCSFCFGDVCMFCVVAATSSAVCQMQHSSAQMLLLAHSVELHPLTTLSPVLQPWKLSHLTRSCKDTGYNTQSICAATSQYTPSSSYAFYLRLKTHISIIVALLMSAAALLHKFTDTGMHL